MSEQEPGINNPERRGKPAEQLTERIEVKHVSKEHYNKPHTPETPSVEHVRHTIEQEARRGKEVPIEEVHKDKDTSQQPVATTLKKDTWDRTMTRTRKRLSPPARTFSKVVHNPVVDTISAVGEKTVARPAGLLMGGIVAFIGSIFVLSLAKHYGFQYNLLLFFLLFCAGYILATLVELALATSRRLRKLR